MTPEHERQLRIQAARRGYNRQQVESFVQFAKTKEASAPPSVVPQPEPGKSLLHKAVDAFIKPPVKAAAQAGVSLYNVVAGTKKALEGNLPAAHREIDATRHLPFVGDVDPLNTPVEGFKAGAEIGLTIAGPGTAKVGAKAAGTAAAKGSANVFERFLPGLSRKLEQSNLRLTPVQKDRLGKELDNITEFLSSKKIIGTPEARYNKVSHLYRQTEDQLQSFLTKDVAGRSVPKNRLVQKLEELKTRYATERDVLAIEKQIDGAIKTLRVRFPKDVPLEHLNKLKRSTYMNAYNKAGDKVLDEVEHNIGDILRETIEHATEGLTINGTPLRAFNQQYGTLIKARKLLRIAKTRKQVGLVGRLVASAMGGALGTGFGPGVGTAFGILAGERAAEAVAGTATKSALGAAARKAAEAGQRLIRSRAGRK